MESSVLCLWISPIDGLTVLQAKAHLESMGIEVGRFEDGDFKTCLVSEESLNQLEEWFGTRYIWGSY